MRPVCSSPLRPPTNSNINLFNTWYVQYEYVGTVQYEFAE